MELLAGGLVGILVLVFITAIDTQSNGFFKQERIGQYGKPFLIYKLRTLHVQSATISGWGKLLRTSKLDESPQILNILKGEMTLVGPRPDPQHYNDEVIWPDKVRINKWYAQNRTLIMDIQIIFYTLVPIPFDVDRFMQGEKVTRD
jgi:lipopolysaccharide/colanic/teichoic acid biosynthesis glycosyltransferase